MQPSNQDCHHWLRYEDLLANYDAEAQRLALFLKADPAKPAVKEAIEFYRSEKAANKQPGAKSPPGSKGQHFQHGVAERFREALTADELEIANKAFEPYLKDMGYE